MKLSRSFFSIYFIVIASFIALSWLMDEVWNSYVEQDVESYTGYKFMLVAIGDYLGNHPEQQWPQIVDTTSQKFNLPLGLTPFENENQLLDQQARSTLSSGETFVYYHGDDVQLFHLLSDKQTLLTLGPAKMPTRPRLEAFIRVGLLVVLGGFILLWLWPISKDLDRLSESAIELSKGNFDSQVPSAKSSIMASMMRTFNMMSNKIKRLIEAHKELTNAVAHELRTPLARSKFALQMMERVDDKDKQARYRQQITNDIIELEELVNEMLVYASFDSDKPQIKVKSVDLAPLIQDQISSMAHYQGEILFDVDENIAAVECDGHFILRAVINYLNNAQKYGGNLIKVGLHINNEQCQISVADNGEGISEELKSKLFDAFARGDESRNKETGGFGLGLAIVTRIMEWHGGKAWVEDSHLGGACFYLQWPIKHQSH